MKQIESQFGLGSVVDGFLLTADEHYRDWFLNNFDVRSPNGSSPNGLYNTCTYYMYCIEILYWDFYVAVGCNSLFFS